ncbi:galactokinase [Maridesulfovibrio salexigens]|uniref:Galactokinase n=1 Tax=Maridesulfovibrio salexigens (strain ATCC 14822 / DSM 2638 / NCIMB 8403 / VKM B-1763) TaxID=526222 RepID=C6BXL6_MARSD|nr:galactokinase family protein [Maridesulfovibrio salexigens]ACS78574.1 Galactokinase [Maridesulfovibrio salexigens DSM 2638]
MHSIEAYRAHLEQGGFDEQFSQIHSRGGVQESRERMRNLLHCMLENFAPDELCFASAPGRTEMGGNHTDHNHGHVLAAAVNLDCLAAFSKSENNAVTILSEGYNPIKVDISDTKPREDEYETSAAIVRGVAEGFSKLGLNIGGFNACVHSTIPAGAGLSSSAAFEVLIGRIFSHLFNDSKIGPLEIASVAKQAENLHFNKPCGFMDQMASSYEGILSIDFTDPANPGVTRVEPEFKTASCADGFYGTGYRLCVIDTGGSHADLTPDYAAIPAEMFEAARSCGQNQAKGLTLNKILDNIDDIREYAGDRAVLRLFHFIGEDERAVNQAKALDDGNMTEFLRLVSESGHSSRELLQNCYSPATPKRQPIPLALTLTEQILGSHGVGRVHGGGFAGTIQVYVHESDFKKYCHSMEKVFGKDSVIELSIRQPGREFLTIPPNRTES